DKYKKSVNYIIEIKDKNSQTIEQFENIIDKYDLHEKVVVQCFDLGALEELEKWDSEMPKLLLCKTSLNFNNGIKSDCVDILSVAKYMMNKKKCNIAHENNKQFSVWTLDKESEIKKAIDLGVDTYFTNDTKLALSLEKKYRK
ncbi:MAG: glycerophosphodiester phosphodiesterase, partial [Alphaproteobacteria bacterium]|nr:glycerophosphodiester phosphodiesterase [Alphaproteobacteria bacterium]